MRPYTNSGGRLSPVVSGDGKVFARVGTDRTVRLWHAGASAVIGQIAYVSQTPGAMALNADGSMLALAIGPTTHLYAAATGLVHQTLARHPSDVQFVGFLPNHGSIITISMTPNGRSTVVLWKAE